MTVPEAPLEDTGNGAVPRGEGWFVVNARDALWQEGVFGAYTRFEGEERRLRAWDFVHCPAWTEHVFVGGEQGCLLLAIGTRSEGAGVVYPASELAQRHGAGVAETTREAKQAYAGLPDDVPTRARGGWLPDF